MAMFMHTAVSNFTKNYLKDGNVYVHSSVKFHQKLSKRWQCLCTHSVKFHQKNTQVISHKTGILETRIQTRFPFTTNSEDAKQMQPNLMYKLKCQTLANN